MSIKDRHRDYVPILKTRKDINQEAKNILNIERSGKQLGLLSRFIKLNIAVGKYFRFKQVTTIAGLSGHGKSALLNILLNDFENKELNKNFKDPFIIVHNNFEMLSVDEVLRTVSSKVGKSHFHLLSSEYKDGSYNTLTDEEFDNISNVLDEEEDSNHYYFEEPTNVMGLVKNIKHAIQHYQDKNQTISIPKVIVALDHTLLVDGEDGDTVIDTITRISKLAVILKKKGYMVILIGQLNGNIEASERLKNPAVHFPLKSDIYAQAQIYNASDNVLIGHQPELLGIKEYGVNKLVTAGLFHLQLIKQRFGKVGSIWLKNKFSEGTLEEFKPVSNLSK